MKIYLVTGVDQGGSGSLTYPEDFETVGAYRTKERAEEVTRLKNEEQGAPLREDFTDDDDYLDAFEEWAEELEMGDTLFGWEEIEVED